MLKSRHSLCNQIKFLTGKPSEYGYKCCRLFQRQCRQIVIAHRQIPLCVLLASPIQDFMEHPEPTTIFLLDTVKAVVPGHPSREVVCYTHALAAASGATGSDSSYSIDTTR